MAATICVYPSCDRPVWRDSTGASSSFCGRAHMRAMANQNPPPPPPTVPTPPSITLCQNCRRRPVYTENGQAHDFCGRRCADAYASNPVPNSTNAEVIGAKCMVEGCDEPAFVGNDGVATSFCSNRHRSAAVTSRVAEGCLMCTRYPKVTVNGRLSDFCSKACSSAAFSQAPIILALPEHHQSYQSVSQQFVDQWKHPSGAPKVQTIGKSSAAQQHMPNILDTGMSATPLRAPIRLGDRDIVTRRHDVETRTGLPNGNTRRRWHGTIRACTLGDDDSCMTLCAAGDPNCSLCNIIRSSFQLARAGQRTNYGRFGHGLYTSATSSKANDYSAERSGTPNKAILLNDVVMGKTTKLTVGDATLREPPAGFDAVVGEPGGSLNYDEAVVYSNDAIRPAYLVIYRP